MSDAAHSLTYRRPSVLDGGRLGLETAGGTALAGPAGNPRFFTGFLTDAAPAAGGLQAIARVARSRYPELTGRPAFRDPVVTCNGDRLRFESFSRCCGVYARLDVLSGGLDGEVHDRGTTNVDINDPPRTALRRDGRGSDESPSAQRESARRGGRGAHRRRHRDGGRRRPRAPSAGRRLHLPVVGGIRRYQGKCKHALAVDVARNGARG
ncbi:hypothetical protein [Saccharopolyspora elongata]|uniref:hypothetical protein n=1 Tax=Saccharopolyspora elongata TaxID=2530387 RepID=UPI001F48FFCB|nr:hypothetical protein [Saccharopolyspora elongata]